MQEDSSQDFSSEEPKDYDPKDKDVPSPGGKKSKEKSCIMTRSQKEKRKIGYEAEKIQRKNDKKHKASTKKDSDKKSKASLEKDKNQQKEKATKSTGKKEVKDLIINQEDAKDSDDQPEIPKGEVEILKEGSETKEKSDKSMRLEPVNRRKDKVKDLQFNSKTDNQGVFKSSYKNKDPIYETGEDAPVSPIIASNPKTTLESPTEKTKPAREIAASFHLVEAFEKYDFFQIPEIQEFLEKLDKLIPLKSINFLSSPKIFLYDREFLVPLNFQLFFQTCVEVWKNLGGEKVETPLIEEAPSQQDHQNIKKEPKPSSFELANKVPEISLCVIKTKDGKELVVFSRDLPNVPFNTVIEMLQADNPTKFCFLFLSTFLNDEDELQFYNLQKENSSKHNFTFHLISPFLLESAFEIYKKMSPSSSIDFKKFKKGFCKAVYYRRSKQTLKFAANQDTLVIDRPKINQLDIKLEEIQNINDVLFSDQENLVSFSSSSEKKISEWKDIIKKSQKIKKPLAAKKKSSDKFTDTKSKKPKETTKKFLPLQEDEESESEASTTFYFGGIELVKVGEYYTFKEMPVVSGWEKFFTMELVDDLIRYVLKPEFEGKISKN